MGNLDIPVHPSCMFLDWGRTHRMGVGLYLPNPACVRWHSLSLCPHPPQAKTVLQIIERNLGGKITGSLALNVKTEVCGVITDANFSSFYLSSNNITKVSLKKSVPWVPPLTVKSRKHLCCQQISFPFHGQCKTKHCLPIAMNAACVLSQTEKRSHAVCFQRAEPMSFTSLGLY